MNATQPVPGLHRVPEWPRLAADVTADGTGTLTVNGQRRACAAESVAALRTGMIARAVAIATQLRRPIRLDVTEDGRTHALAVRPEGYVQLVGADGTIPAADGLYVLQLNVDGPDAAGDVLASATEKIDSDTTIG